VAGALVGATLMGLGWQFGSVFSLLAVPAVIAAAGVFVVAGRARELRLEEVEFAPAVE
jgi:AAHS family 4-hydroxybenzoate transporter-like MFS transporter